jgi:hypothetical protein
MVMVVNWSQPKIAVAGAEDAMVVFEYGDGLHHHADFLLKRMVSLKNDFYAFGLDVADRRQSYELDGHCVPLKIVRVFSIVQPWR